MFSGFVNPRDYFIVSIGDSFASGEGNPDVPCRGFNGCADEDPVWQYKDCHRSEWAGPSRSALALESSSDQSSVTLLHLACSGATVPKGLLASFNGVVTKDQLDAP